MCILIFCLCMSNISQNILWKFLILLTKYYKNDLYVLNKIKKFKYIIIYKQINEII